MVLSRETQIYRLDARKGGELLTPKEREDLAKPYLPAPPSKPPPSNSSTRKPHRRRIRPFLKTQLHLLVYFLIHALFSLYIRLRQFTHAILSRALAILYYHHRTPELIRKDVKSLPRVPQHLSVILSLPPSNGAGPVGLEELLDDVAEIAAWSACVGIPMLSIYERTGVLQKYIPTTHRAVARKLQAYFGRRRPSLKVGAPHVGGFQNGDGVGEGQGVGDCGHLSILLLSSSDGRSTLVDLTKTLAEMVQYGKIVPQDITQDLINEQISQSIMDEPDLLLLFGPNVILQGYPPWQLRLTEIFHVQDNGAVEYQAFLRALYSYAKAQMRFGR